MTTSRLIAALAGPYLVATGITEAINLRAMGAEPASVVLVYLNGSLLFVAGVAILRVHNRWSRTWPVLVTVTGWSALLGGLARMIAPRQTTSDSNGAYVLLAIMTVVGAILTREGYRNR